MSKLIKRLWEAQSRIRQLARIMTFRSALTILFSKGEQREIEVHLRQLGRRVVIRQGTSDLECLLKIFLAEEYSSPFRVFPKLIVDAGANIGMGTLYFASRYPQARVIAIEPESSNFLLLKRNCENLPNITLLQGALWPSEREVVLAEPNAEKWAFSVVEANNASPDTSKIRTVTIPGILELLGEKYIDFLKIDIEGAERDLFLSNPEQWLQKVGTISIELHDRCRPGCARAFYSAVAKYNFSHEVRGENIFIQFNERAS